MEFLTRRPAPRPCAAQLLLATPLMPEDGVSVGRRISGQVLAGLSPDSRVVGETVVPGEGDLPFTVLELRIVAEEPGQVVAGLVGGLEEMGVGRGTQLVVEGRPVELGDREVVVLTVPDEVVAAVQDLRSAVAEVAVHVSTCPAAGGRHLVFEGIDAAAVMAVLRAEIVHHPALGDAALRSITPGAAEAEPVTHPRRVGDPAG